MIARIFYKLAFGVKANCWGNVFINFKFWDVFPLYLMIKLQK